MAKNNDQKSNMTYSLSRTNDGTVEIVFSFPILMIEEAKVNATKALSAKIDVPGFRRGKAPMEKVLPRIPENTLVERVLSDLLPEAVGKVLTAEKIAPAIYPKFELIKANPGEEWQVKGTTCELPNVKLDGFENAIKAIKSTDGIWTPDKEGKPEKSQEQINLEKEQEVLKVLLERYKPQVPKILIDEEVNSRLANLLARIERLGLKLESYLASVGKNPEGLRQEYQAQAEQTIALDLILNEIATKQKIDADKVKVDEALNSIKSNPNIHDERSKDEQKAIIESVLRRRAAVDWLISLI